MQMSNSSADFYSKENENCQMLMKVYNQIIHLWFILDYLRHENAINLFIMYKKNII